MVIIVPIKSDYTDSDGDRILTTFDFENREYEKVMFSKPVDLVVAFGKYNRVIPVLVNVSFRKGQSVYGEQMVFQLIYKGDDSSLKKLWERTKYRKKSPVNHVEFYFSGNIKSILNKVNKLIEQ